MDFPAQRERIFAEYERGASTATDVQIRFVALMIETSNDAVALSLCESLPDWFRDQFRTYLQNNASTGYAHRWFSMGDPRTKEQVESDARRHGDFLERLAPDILANI